MGSFRFRRYFNISQFRSFQNCSCNGGYSITSDRKWFSFQSPRHNQSTWILEKVKISKQKLNISDLAEWISWKSIINMLYIHVHFYHKLWGCHGRDRLVGGFTTTYAISAYHQWCEFESRSGRGEQHYVIKFVERILTGHFHILLGGLLTGHFHILLGGL